jgi:hypothetical protein
VELDSTLWLQCLGISECWDDEFQHPAAAVTEFLRDSVEELLQVAPWPVCTRILDDRKLEPEILESLSGPMTVRAVWQDSGTTAWRLEAADPEGLRQSPEVTSHGLGAWRTSSFTLSQPPTRLGSGEARICSSE